MERTWEDVFREISTGAFLFIRQFKVKGGREVSGGTALNDKCPSLGNIELCCYIVLTHLSQLWEEERGDVHRKHTCHKSPFRSRGYVEQKVFDRRQR